MPAAAVLDQAGEIELSTDIFKGAKLTTYYLEQRNCSPGTGSGNVPGTGW